jgi:parallel beta-helix repeat protein
VKRIISVLFALVLMLSFSLVTAMPAAAATITVGPGGPPTYDYATIQSAVTAAGPGDTINVAAGTYNENVVIPTGKDGLQIIGHSNADTFITGGITAFDCSSQVTINGFDISDCFYGIVIRSTTGSSIISGNNISNTTNEGVFATGPGTITDNNISGCGYGIQTRDNAGGSTISGNTVSNITNEGINAFVPSTITGNNISGCGWGIRIQNGAAGSTVSGNTITNTTYEGIWAYGLVAISDNNISVPYAVIQITGNAGGSTISGNTISGVPGYQGILAFVPSTITGNDISGCGWGIQIRNHSTGTVIDWNNIHDNTYHGIDIPNFGGETDVTEATITNNTFTDNGWTGIRVGGGTVSSGINIHFNNFVGNGIYGVESVIAGSMVAAENNWWGANDGPSGVGPGNGDAVSANVDYDPWLRRESGTPSATGTGTVTFEVDSGGITDLTAVAEATLPTAGKPRGVTFPYGLFSFNIIGVTPGSCVTVTITFPSPLTVGAQYWKFQNGNWIDCTSLLGDNDGDNVLTLTLCDGGLGDADGAANGTIVDPGGPATISVSASTTGPGVSPTPPRPLNPAQLSIQYLNVNPQQTTVSQPLTITTNVVNTGDEAGNLNVALKINGQVEQTKMVSVGPQGTQPVKFTVTKAQPGTYTVDIAGQRGSFIVLGSSGSTSGTGASGGLIAVLLVVMLILVTVVVLLVTFRRRAY